MQGRQVFSWDLRKEYMYSSIFLGINRWVLIHNEEFKEQNLKNLLHHASDLDCILHVTFGIDVHEFD